MKHYLSKIPTCLLLLFIPFSANQLSRDVTVVECRPKLNSLWCSPQMPSSVNGFNFSEIPDTTLNLYIDCKDKSINFPSSDSFMNLKNLFVLMIFNCPSLRLSEKLYLPQQHLSVLSLWNNGFTSDIFGKLKPSNSLTVLNLSFNKIKTLDFEFRIFPNLRELHLNYNNIQNITSNAFKNCYKVRNISLNYNSISTLVYKNELGKKTNIFDSKNLPNLKYLNLENNEIFHIDLSMIPQTVETLELLFNPIHNFSCNEPYVKDHELKVLTADWTLHEYSNICFPPSLETVTLTNVTIWRLPRKIISAFIHFRKSQLKRNNFVFVVDRAISFFSDISNFTVMFLFNNKCVHERFFNVSERGKFIFLYDNILFSEQQIELIPVHNENSTVYCQFRQTCFFVERYDLNRRIVLGKPDFVYFTLSIRRDPVVDCGNLLLTEIPSSLPNNNKELFLDGNNLSSVNLQQILEDYPHLEALYLNKSNIHEIELKNRSLFTSVVQELHLESNFLKIFPVKLIRYLRYLTSLHLQNNSLMEFKMEIGHSLSLDDLHLEYNNISSFNIGKSTNVSINSLYLQYNRISKIEKKFCNYLIEILYLDNNEITEVELNCNNADSSSKLRKLFLRNNFLTVLKSFSFSTLINLEELHLEGNMIEHLEENCFYDLSELNKLFLQRNKLKYFGQIMLPVITDRGIYQYYLLNLYKWIFNSHDLGIKEESWNLSKNSRKLDLLLDAINIKSYFIEVDFGGNFIERIDLSVFNRLPFLVSIRLNNNSLREISCDQSLSLAFLKEIHLEENRLTRLNGGEFKGLTRVTKLYLHQNEIVFISKDTFKDMTSLVILTLHGNKFQRLDILQFGFSSNFQMLTIHQNPIVCECTYLDDIRDVLKSVNFISNVSEVGCLSKENKNYLLEDYMIRFCDNKQMIIGLAVSIGLLLLTGSIGVLLYRYRLEIQVILYSRFGVRFFHDQSLDERKPFHAFIAYSCEDSEFVAQQLLPGLEKYRLCLHDRNFVVGAFIQENIVNAVNHSACTVIVFSTSFVKSPWCRFEFRTAHDKSLNKGCRPIIVIVLEDVKPDDMEEEMKVYLTTSTYLRWGDQLFWEKLYFVLPSLNRNDNDRIDHRDIPLLQYNS